MGAGVVGPLLDQAAAEARLQAAGEDDHALGVGGEHLHVDVGLAAREALEEAGRGELDQVGEAGVALGQQGEVVALVFRLLLDRLHVVDEVGLEADDRLDPVLLAGLVEVDGAVHHAVVGEAQRRLPQLGGAGRHRVDLAGAVEQRVLAVGVEVDGGGVLTVVGRSCQPRQMPRLGSSFRASSAHLPLSYFGCRYRPAPCQAQTQAPPPESAQISAAMRSCSAFGASWGAPWPP